MSNTVKELISAFLAILAFSVTLWPARASADLFVPGKTYNADVQFCTTFEQADAVAAAIVNGGPNGPPICGHSRIAFETLHAVKEHRRGLILTRVYAVRELNTESTLYVIVISLITPPSTYKFS